MATQIRYHLALMYLASLYNCTCSLMELDLVAAAMAVAVTEYPPAIKKCLAHDKMVSLNASVESAASVQTLFKPSKHCGVGHRPATGRVIFSRNLCGLPEQGQESTQVEPSLEEDKRYMVKIGDSVLLKEKIDKAKNEIKAIDEEKVLKESFNSMKHILAARFLLLPKGISDPSTRLLRDQFFIANHREPDFLSSSELARQRNRIGDPEEWKRLMNMIISRRVFIANEWKANVGNIEMSRYYYAIRGAKGDPEFYRGEVDASFHDGKPLDTATTTTTTKTRGTATLSILLWKGDKIVHAEVFKGVDCVSIHAAEAYAALALCFYCIENGVRDLELWTDNSDIHGAIYGSLPVKSGGPIEYLLLLLGCMGKKFNRLISMNKRREQLFLADDLAQPDEQTRSWEQYLKKWDYELRGKALFRLSRSSSVNQIMKNPKPKQYRGGPKTEYFMEINEANKLEVISVVADTLRPGSVYVAIAHLDEKPKDYSSQLEGIVGLKLVHKTVVENCSLLEFGTGWKGLLVVFDASIPARCYKHLVFFTIIFTGPGEKELLDPTIEEASALTYVYFNGVLAGSRGTSGNVVQKVVS